MQQFKRSFFPMIALAIALAMTFGVTAQAGGDDAAAAVAALYAEDGRVVTGDGKIMNGRAEIQSLFQSFIDGGFHDHKIEMIDVKVKGDIAIETGKWSGVGGDKKTYGGHLVNVYERQSGGDWQGILHIWN